MRVAEGQFSTLSAKYPKNGAMMAYTPGPMRNTTPTRVGLRPY